MSKVALDGVSPVLLLVLQLLPSVALLWLVVYIRRIPLGKRRDIARFAWLGVLEPGLAFLVFLIGLTDIKAGAATLIQSSEAIMIVIVSACLLGVKPTMRFVVLSLLAFAGLLLALGFANPEDLQGNGYFGIAMLFATSAIAACYVVLSSRIASGTDPVAIVAWQQSVSLIFALLVLALEAFWRGQLPMLPSKPDVWLVVIVSGIVQYALAFSLYMRALGSVSANVAGSFLNLMPIFGLAGGFLFLSERLSLVQLLGAAITIVAVTLISRGDHAVAH